jgi:hypothetical protein
MTQIQLKAVIFHSRKANKITWNKKIVFNFSDSVTIPFHCV